MFSFSKLCQITQLCSDSHLTESKFLIHWESAGQETGSSRGQPKDKCASLARTWPLPTGSWPTAERRGGGGGGYISCLLCFYRSKSWAKHPKLPLWDLPPLLLTEMKCLKKGNVKCQCLCPWQCGSKCGLVLDILFLKKSTKKGKRVNMQGPTSLWVTHFTLWESWKQN